MRVDSLGVRVPQLYRCTAQSLASADAVGGGVAAVAAVVAAAAAAV